MAWILALIAVAAAVESFALPGWVTEAVRPQFTIVLVIGWAMLRGWEEGAIVGVAAGFFLALSSAAPLGTSVVRLAVVGVLAGLGMARFVRVSNLVLLGAGFLGSMLSFMISVLGLQAAGWSVSWERDLLFVAVPSAIMTSLLVFAVFPALRFIERLTIAQSEEAPL